MTRKPKAAPKPVPVLAQRHARPPLPVTDPATGPALIRREGVNIVAAAEKRMAAVLTAAGMPTEPRYRFEYETEGGGHGSCSDLARFAIHRGHPIGSEVWYAAKITEEIADVRRATATGGPDRILHTALHLGALLMEANIVVPNPRAFDAGLRQLTVNTATLSAANRKRAAKAATGHRRWRAEAKAIWKHNKRLSESCALRVVDRLGLKKAQGRNVRRVIAELDPKKVGHAG